VNRIGGAAGIVQREKPELLVRRPVEDSRCECRDEKVRPDCDTGL
jgi:hypothetical protein